MKKWKIHVVPHSHWDKEWYFTKQDSDVLLIKNMENIFNTFEDKNNKYKTFTYDGQYSVFEDYLNYYPENKDKIKKLVQSNHLTSGPWYTQPDFFNTTSESIIRNLLFGIKLSTENFGNYLKVAYVPDSFGHNSQMPQIYSQFNLKNFIYWRGVREREIDKTSTYHKWEGIDGSKINAYNFFLGYWPIGSFFPYSTLTDKNIESMAKEFLIKTESVINVLKSKSKNTDNILLLPLGGDQAPIVKLLPSFFEFVNKHTDDEWVVSDYESYFNDMENAKREESSIIKGELKSPNKSRIHKTIGSQRFDIKKLLKETEILLYNNLEPLCVYWSSKGGKYPRETINQALKWILMSQAHDSAGGCNSDRTNQDVLNRLEMARDLIKSEITKIIKQIHINNGLKSDEVILFNPSTENKKISNEITIFTKTKNFQILENKKEVKYAIINQFLNDSGTSVTASATGESTSKTDEFYKTTLIFEDYLMNPTSLSILSIKENDGTLGIVYSNDKNIENNTWKIMINDDGTLDIYDKLNNKKYLRQFELYSDYDAGDSYDYSPINHKNLRTNKLISQEYKVKKISDNGILIEINEIHKIPSMLNFDETKTIYVKQSINKVILLLEKRPIDIKIQLKNIAKNIRWKIISSVNEVNEFSFANQAYSTIKRPIELKQDLIEWEKGLWTEKPVSIETNESFVYLNNDNTVSGFITNGNNEYEVVDRNKIHITLFRSIDVLGRDDLLWRPGRASGTSEFKIQTPDATLMNKEIEIKLGWFSEKENSNIWKIAEIFITPTIYYQSQKLNPLFKKFDRFLLMESDTKFDINNISLISINNDKFIIKTLKQSWDGKSLVVRGFNSSAEDIKIKISKNGNNVELQKTNMLEEVIDTISEDKLRSMEIGTYLIK